jgi:glycosyltransferase involved in cell wall biosynthesis
MVVRDGERYLPEAVESVLGQTLHLLELIVVDDGSEDDTPAILSDFERRDSRVRAVHQAARGVPEARNAGCALANGRYLAILDADDVALHERLELQVSFLDSHPNVAVVGGAGFIIDDRGEHLALISYPDADEEVAAALHSGRSPVIHSAATIRKSAFDAVSGYRRAMEIAQDYDLWLRIIEHGRVTNVAEPVVRYRMHEGQHSTRSLERSARATCAALASARVRESGGPDPLDSAEQLDDRVLTSLGVTPDDVAAQEVEYAL